MKRFSKSIYITCDCSRCIAYCFKLPSVQMKTKTEMSSLRAATFVNGKYLQSSHNYPSVSLTPLSESEFSSDFPFFFQQNDYEK